MNDDSPKDATDQPADEAAAEQQEGAVPPIMIGAQYIKDLSFENPLGPEVLATLSESPRVNIDVNTSARTLEKNVYEVALFIRGEAETEGKTVFIIELTYAGIVTLTNVPEEHVEPGLLIEAARHLFPYARAVVSEITRDGGFPPLLINPIDFAALYTERLATENSTEKTTEKTTED